MDEHSDDELDRLMPWSDLPDGCKFFGVGFDAYFIIIILD